MKTSTNNTSSSSTITPDNKNDKLSVPFNCTSRQSSLLVAIFNLVATIVGGGVLSLPLAFEKCGIVIASFLMVFAAIITDRSLYLLCLTARKTGASSYAEVGRISFGSWMDWFISGLLCLFLVFVLTAYMVLLKDIWTPLVTTTAVTVDDTMVLFVLLLFMIPFLIQRTLHTLRFNCYIGFIAVSILCWSLIHHGILEVTSSTTTERLKLYPDNYGDVLFAFPIIVLSFLSAFNVLSVQNNLYRPTRQRVQYVIRMAVLVCFALQYIFGLGGYLFAQSSTQGNILLNCNHEKDWMFFIGRLGCGITLLLALAMMMLPCRQNLLEFLTPIIIALQHKQKATTLSIPSETNQEDEEQLAVVVGEETSLLSSTNDESSSSSVVTIKTSLWWHYGTTFGIALTAYLGAIMAPGVAFVWSLCGSSMAFLIAFILPTACYLAIVRRAKQQPSTKQWIYFSWFLILLSLLSAIACTCRTVAVLLL